MDAAPLVAFTRGPILESIHYGSIAVVNADGRLLASVGDPERLTTLRSTAKPFQAMAVVETGAFDHFSGTAPELALIAGSHSGEPRHTEAVADMLARAGLGADALQTGTHPPLDAATRADLDASGQPPTVLHHNCSGKHTGMLWCCIHRGWDERTYVRPDHPLQRRIRSIVAVASSWPEADIPLGTDGCSVPTFALPLSALAHAFARFGSGQGLSETHAVAAGRVRGAMLDHPDMVGGTGRFDTDLMSAAPYRIVSKAGAEGCHVIAAMEAGWAVAAKIEDGSARAAPVALLEALRQLGILADAELDALSSHACPSVRDYRNEIVGEARPVFTLSAARDRIPTPVEQ
jgi:L-asparaginase II